MPHHQAPDPWAHLKPKPAPRWKRPLDFGEGPLERPTGPSRLGGGWMPEGACVRREPWQRAAEERGQPVKNHQERWNESKRQR